MNGLGSKDQPADQPSFARMSPEFDEQSDERGATAGATEGSTESAGYVIAVAAARAGVHAQTLRHYERLGLISPARKGTRPRSPRLYSERDIERVIHIRRLMGDLGVNLAGVEIILSMRERLEGLQRELQQLRRQYE